MKFAKYVFCLITLSFLAGQAFAKMPKLKFQPKEKVPQIPSEPEKLDILRRAYPDVNFTSQYDELHKDWKITLQIPSGQSFRESVLYWADGSLLPPEELPNKDKYWTILYYYNYKNPLADPANFTQEQIDALKRFGSNENRKNGAGTPMFFFDELYDSKTRTSLEAHIIKTTFLGKTINIHERIKEPLAKVEKQVLEIAKTDSEVQKFLDGLYHNEAYYWRLIANTNRKSFHSLGIAVDVLPKSYGGKQVYWSWAKDSDPENWMLTPLARRWMPPQVVIEIFEKEGFIWGGKWMIWDNMHFEYHPELILYSSDQN